MLGFFPSLRETLKKRKFKDESKEEENKLGQKRQQKDMRGGNDRTDATIERREMR